MGFDAGAKIVLPSMKKLSVSMKKDHVKRIDEKKEADQITSRSEAVRRILSEYDDLRTECEDLRTECEELRDRLDSREDRIKELERQLAQRSQIEEKVDVLANRVERQEQTSTAPFWVRWKKYYFGNPENSEN